MRTNKKTDYFAKELASNVGDTFFANHFFFSMRCPDSKVLLDDFKKNPSYWVKTFINSESRFIFWMAQFSTNERAIRYATKKDEKEVNGKSTSALYHGILLRYGIFSACYGEEKFQLIIEHYRSEIKKQLIQNKKQIDEARSKKNGKKLPNLCRDIFDIDTFWARDKDVGVFILDEVSKSNKDRRRIITKPALIEYYEEQNDHLLKSFISSAIKKSGKNNRIASAKLELAGVFGDIENATILQKSYKLETGSSRIGFKYETTQLHTVLNERIERGLNVFFKNLVKNNIKNPKNKTALIEIVTEHFMSKKRSTTKPSEDSSSQKLKAKRKSELTVTKYLKEIK